MFKKLFLLSAVFAFVGVSATFTYADPIGTTATFSLTEDGCTGTCGVAPFGTIDLLQTTSSTVKVTLTLNQSHGIEMFAGGGAGDALEFNLAGNPSPITIGSITSGFGVGPAPDTASTFGSFMYSVTCTSCTGGKSTNPSGPLSFTVTDAAGVGVSDFIGNSDKHGNFYFASDIFGNNGNTGNVAALAGTTTAVPEPSSLMLFGTGALCFAGLVRRRLF